MSHAKKASGARRAQKSGDAPIVQPEPQRPTAPAPEQFGEYVADPRVYRSEVLTPAYGSIAFCVLGVLLVFFGFVNLGDMMALARVAGIVMIIGGAYTLQRSFLAHAFPRVIRLDAAGIEFESFGHVDRFAGEGLVRCAVREGAKGRSFLRIEDGSSARRFFLNCNDMASSDGRSGLVVQEYLFEQEARLDPSNIRVRARKVNAKKEAEAAAALDAGSKK